jgi:saccharopine dehydrogenase-like protein
VNRVIVVGGSGFFGAAAADALRREGQRVLVASRRPSAGLRMDAEDAGSIHAALAPGDVVIDAAGAFQRRSTTLLEACLSIGCDVIDLADSLDYVSNVQALSMRVTAPRTRVLTACSSVSAVSAALVRLAGVEAPVRVSTFLAPATRNTSTPATTWSFFSAIGRDVRLLRDGALVQRPALSETRALGFPPPVGPVSAMLAESADAIMLPKVWPTLKHVDFWVDARRSVFNRLLAVAARMPRVLSLVRAIEPAGRPLAKLAGARSGGFAVVVEDANGRRVAAGFVDSAQSYLVAVAPAILATRHLAAGSFDATGFVPADQQVNPFELREWLQRAGVSYFELRPST